jgi:autotransporter-associated beta strand protein
MVLSYAYSPPRWIARCDPPAGPGPDLKLNKFKLSFNFDPNRMELPLPDGATAKFPFVFNPNPPPPVNGLINVQGETNNPISPKDVDIFELAFNPCSGCRLAAAPLIENFDGVVAPALPPAWTTTGIGAGSPWFTSTTAPNSAPNAGSAVANPNLGESQLFSPQFLVPAGGARVAFKNRYNLEAGHDGMVLEISINGTPFADIIAAGGAFISGGYNGPITGANGSPIAGRNAWSGNSVGWINTAVNLPAAANGQPAQLRWRLATDDSPGAGVGAQLDDIVVDPPQPSFTVRADSMTVDFLEATDGQSPPTIVHYDATQIAPTTRVFTPGVLPHIWDPDGLYNNGIIGGAGSWNTTSTQWDDLPYPPQTLVDSIWDNVTHANDFAVFGGNPGTGIVTVVGSISVGGFQFDISGYDIQGGNLVFPLSAPTSTVIETNANTATISSPISGGAFTKVGTGTLILAGSNTYTGTTTINAGTLLLNNSAGSGTGTSAVMVNSGGVVGGNGQIGSGPVGVADGGAIQGGDGTAPAGVLTVGANLGFATGSIIKLALGPGGAHSTLNRVAGTWSFQANQGFTFINLSAQPGVYDNVITGLASDPGVGSWHINNPGFTGTFSYDSANHSVDLNIMSAPTPIQVTSVVSRKIHGGAGTFDINLPLVSPFGIECRSGQGAAGTNHQMVITFASPVTVGGAAVTSGTGAVAGSPNVAGSVVTINLTGVANAQTIAVTLSNVNDGVSTGDVVVSMRTLKGDTSGNGAVTGTDVAQTKAQTGHAVTAGNFREDVVVTGTINGSDVALVKLFTGTALP